MAPDARSSVSFLRRLPLVNPAVESDHFIDIVVEELEKEHVFFWDSRIQRTIDESTEPRADRGWNWCDILNGWTALFSSMLSQRPVGYALGVLKDDGFIPCALVMLAGRYVAFDDTSKEAVFLWYLTTAPDHALKSYWPSIRVPKRLGVASLDLAVCHSFQCGLEGRVGLHAAHEGGDGLLRWYENCGMSRVSAVASFVLRYRIARRNDGRYFYFDPPGAKKWSLALDHLRTPGHN